MNQTNEILIGISQQTGMQFNELLDMMTHYYVFKNVLSLICLMIGIIITLIIIYMSYNYLNEKHKDDHWFDTESMIFSMIIPTVAGAGIVLVLLMWIMDAVLGIMFPKEQMIEHIINQVLYSVV